MPVVQEGIKNRQAVSPGVTAAAILALLAFIGFLAYANFRPSTAALKVPKSATTRWIEQKAAETNGDYAKLSPEDQQKLQQLSRGRGEMMLKMLAPKK
jgi:hypothetical protein